ncbi:YciI family protein [Angustibacter aerolatus]
MKYVILIHSNPDPWGHPTSAYTPEGRAVPPEQAAESDRAFDELLAELSSSGELLSGEALGDPSTSTVFGWTPQGHVAMDGPYAEAKEQLAGFFVVDCETRERADAVAARFAGPGSTVELRPMMWPGGDEQ